MKERILSILNKRQAVSLATVEGDQPRLRPMTLIVKEGRFYFATGSTDEKTRQIDGNNKAEFCLLLPSGNNTGYLRGSGQMKKVQSMPEKKEVADWAQFIYDYWKEASDPDFVLYELELRQIRYMEPGDMKETVMDWD